MNGWGMATCGASASADCATPSAVSRAGTEHSHRSTAGHMGQAMRARHTASVTGK